MPPEPPRLTPAVLSRPGPWWHPLPEPPEDDGLTIEHVMRAAAIHFGIRVTDLTIRRRSLDIVWRRHVAIYLACQLTTRSLPMIGRAFGNDHTTVLHARDRIETMKDHPDVQAVKGMIRGDIQRAREARLADPNQLALEV